MYPLSPDRRHKRLLAVLAATQIQPGSGPTNLTTSEVVSELPGNPSRKRVVKALRELEGAGYTYEATRWVQHTNGPGKSRFTAWQITPTGLRVALGALS